MPKVQMSDLIFIDLGPISPGFPNRAIRPLSHWTSTAPALSMAFEYDRGPQTVGTDVCLAVLLCCYAPPVNMRTLEPKPPDTPGQISPSKQWGTSIKYVCTFARTYCIINLHSGDFANRPLPPKGCRRFGLASSN